MGGGSGAEPTIQGCKGDNFVTYFFLFFLFMALINADPIPFDWSRLSYIYIWGRGSVGSVVEGPRGLRLCYSCFM